MKSLKNGAPLVVGCLVLSASFVLPVIAQKEPARQGKSSARKVKCADNDTECFIRAAGTCRKASLTMTKPLVTWNPDAPHPTQVQVARYEIRGGREDKCVFYSKVEKSDVKYGEDYIRYVMKKEVRTRKEVDQMMSEQRQAFRQMEGRFGICSFQQEQLVAMLNRWWQKDGGANISTKDFEGADCQGTLYDFTLPDRTIGLSKPPPAKPLQ